MWPRWKKPAPHQVEAIGLGVDGRALRDVSRSCGSILRRSALDDGTRDIVLQFEDVLELAVIAFGPHMAVGAPVDQLRGDAHPVVHLAHAAFEQVLHAEPRRHLVDVDVLSLVGEGGVARDDEQRRDLREIGDDVLGDAVAEIVLLRVAAHVDEGQHRDRGLVRRSRAACGRQQSPCPAARDRPARCPRCSSAGGGPCPRSLATGGGAHAGRPSPRCRCRRARRCPAAARRHSRRRRTRRCCSTMTSERLMPMRKLIRRSSGSVGVARLAGLLHVDGEAHGIHHARKLGQEAIAQRLDDAAAMPARSAGR